MADTKIYKNRRRKNYVINRFVRAEKQNGCIFANPMIFFFAFGSPLINICRRRLHSVGLAREEGFQECDETAFKVNAIHELFNIIFGQLFHQHST